MKQKSFRRLLEDDFSHYEVCLEMREKDDGTNVLQPVVFRPFQEVICYLQSKGWQVISSGETGKGSKPRAWAHLVEPE